MSDTLGGAQTIVNEIRQIISSARANVAKQVNNEILMAYWNIGKIIVENEQQGSGKADYGKQLIKNLSKELSKELGSGFSKSNLFNMRALYLNYPIFQTVSGKLTWSHYCELLSVSDKDARSFYEKEAVNSNWSVRELRRQINTSLFQRLILSNGNINKEKVLLLAKEGMKIGKLKPENIGQMNMYVNYYAAEVNDEYDDKPIGIILCADNSEIVAEYALGGMENQIFTSKYVYYIPDKEQLIKQVEDVLNDLKEENNE